MNRKTLCLAAIVTAATVIPTEVAQAHTCASGIDWATDVHHHTDLSCVEATNIWNNRPLSWRDDFPGNHIVTSTATKLPSPALSGMFAQEWCKITTVAKYRAPVIPFGDHVLFSMRMTQTFSYDGTQVSAAAPVLSPDTTSLGWRWHFNGIALDQDYYTVTPFHWQHFSERWSAFATHGVAQLAAVHSTIYTKVMAQGNGDWATTNTNGVSDCRNP